MDSDLKLVERYAAKRDGSALEALVRRYQGFVYAVCYRIHGEPHGAADSTQECFVKFAREAGNIRQSPAGWLHRCATRTALRAVQSERARRRRELTYARRRVSADLPDGAWDEISPHLDAALDELPDELRYVVVEHLLRERPQAQLAEELNVSAATISRRVQHGVTGLRWGLRRAGIAVPTALLVTLLAQKTSVAAPAAVAASLAKVGATGLGVKTPIIVGLVAAALVGTAVVGRAVTRSKPLPPVRPPAVEEETPVKNDAPTTPPAPADKAPERLVLEAVPTYRYMKDGMNPFALALKSCTDFLGEDYTYDYILGTSGACFRMSWNYTRWDGGNMDLARLGPEPFRQGCRAVGLTCRFLVKKPHWPGVRADDVLVIDDTDDPRDILRDEIIASLRKGMPVLAFGVVGPPEVSIIAGYDEGGDVLIGRSSFQGGLPGVEEGLPADQLEPNGMFRKSDWFADTQGIIVLERADDKPDTEQIFADALRWAYRVCTLPKSTTHVFGRAAFAGWAGGMLKDADFPVDEPEMVQERRHSVWDGMIMMAERGAAAGFLETIAKTNPDVARHLNEAARLFREEGECCGRMLKPLGGPMLPSPPFAEPTARRSAADIILRARDLHTQAVRHLRMALVPKGTLTPDRIVWRDTFQVLGLQERFTPENEDHAGHWKRYMAFNDVVEARKAEDAHYNIYFAVPGDNDALDSLAGMRVAKAAAAPDGLTLRAVPGSVYAVFDCTVPTIHETWEKIHRDWLPASGLRQNPKGADFDRYLKDGVELHLTLDVKRGSAGTPFAERKLVGLRPARRAMTLLGSLLGCMRYVGNDTDDAWVYGVTGAAFMMNIDANVDVSGPTSWGHERITTMAPYLGVTLEHTVQGRQHASDFQDRRREARAFLQAKVAANIPCFGFDGGFPEYFTVNAAGSDDVVYWTHYVDDGCMIRPWKKAGINDVEFFEYVSVEPCERKGDDRAAVREALQFALRIGRSKPANPRENAQGLAGYDEWIRCLETGAWRSAQNLPGVHHNVACWSECRAYAERFLRLAGDRLGGDLKPLFDEAAGHYRTVWKSLVEMQTVFIYKYPLPPVDDAGIARGLELLRTAWQAEINGLAVIEAILARMDTTQQDRLVIRRFTPEDWPGVLELGRDKEASPGAKLDQTWPTTEEGAKGAATFFSKGEGFWAVCLKEDGRLIGFISFNGVDEEGHLDLGHVFHTRFSGGDCDAEAIAIMIGRAFGNPKVKAIITRNAEEWPGQIEPLKKVGMKPLGREKGSFHKDAAGNPIEFTAVEMGITREEWAARH